MIVHVSYNATSCVDCPYLRKGIGSLSNVVLYSCTNGIFGALDEHGHTTGPPYGCLLFNGLDRVASKLGVSRRKLERIFEEECCILKELKYGDE